MKYGVFSDKEWLLEDSESSIKDVNIVCAKNSYACFQLVIKAKGDISVSCDGGICFDVFRLVPTLVNKNSKFMEELDYERTSIEEMSKYYIKKAPYYVYDAMIPLQDNFMHSDNKAYLYFKGKTEVCGDIQGNITVSVNNDTAVIPYSVKVMNAAVPDERNFNMINWISFSRKKYGCELYDDRFWHIVEKTVELSKISRQKYVNASTCFILRKENGEFDFTHLNRYINLCFENKYNHIEGPDMVSIYNKFLKEENNGEDFYTDKAIETLTPFLVQWYGFLKENNWIDITIQHVFDEPRDKNIEHYNKVAAVVKQYMPGIKLVDTTLTLKIGEAPDILIPTTRFYQLHRDFFESLREQGRELWNYTCCWPSAPYLNRFLDMPLLDVRLIHWLNYHTNCAGYLHWGFCFFANDIDQFKAPSIPFRIFDDSLEQWLPAGDTNIIYEYEGEPVGSVRLEMQRAGVEDYELLCMLKDKEYAHKLVSECITDKFTGIKSVSLFNTVYEKLLRQIEQQ